MDSRRLTPEEFMTTLNFGHLSRSDIKNNYSLHERNHGTCKIISMVSDSDIMEKRKLYLTSGTTILGAITHKYEGEIGGNHIIYIGSRCTYETPELNMPDTFASKGRLLWIYFLNYVFTTYGKGDSNIIVYNTSLRSAYGYHIKMGMVPYTEDLFTPTLIPEILRIDIDEGKDTIKDYLRHIHDDEYNFLFYKFKADVDYNNVYAILLSLPESERHKKFGGHSKRKKKSKRKTPRLSKKLK